MAPDEIDKPPSDARPARSTAAAITDIGLVVLGLALLASAFSNVPVKVSGLVNVDLAAPGVLLVQVVFGVVGIALLLLGMAGLFDRRGHASSAWAQWRRWRAPRPRPAPAVNVGLPPPRNPLFRGREVELEHLARRLHDERRVEVTGLGGIGKSSLALEYLHRHRSDYPDGIFWLRGHSEVMLMSDFADLAWLPELNLPERDEPALERMVGGVARWLAGREGWLLVVDNLDPDQTAVLDRLLTHRPMGHVLITCRVSIGSYPLPVHALSPEAAAGYLLERTGESDQVAAAEIGRLLEHLPLALEQAAAYVRDTGRSLAAYADLARDRLAHLLREGRPRDYPDSVATAWSLSFGRIERESPAATAVLRICANMAPEGIPLRLLKAAAAYLAGESAAAIADEVGLDKAIMPLRRYAMVVRQGETLRIHRLVQAVVRDLPIQREWIGVALGALRDEFPGDVWEPRIWPDCAALMPHVLAVVALSEPLATEEAATDSWVSDRAGSYLQARGQLRQARPLLERALRIREKVLGPDHPDTAQSLNNMAWLLRAQGKPGAAQLLCERALTIREKVLRPDHPDTATSFNNLAVMLQSQGELGPARPLYERALGIRENVLGPDHPDTAQSLNNLAWLLQTQGELEAARPLYERALAIREKVLGPDHPSTATSLNDLAVLLQAQGKVEAVRPLCERALAIREKVLGPDHPDTVSTRATLADLAH